MPSKSKLNVTLAHIQEAKQMLAEHLEPSPLLFNSWLSEAFDCEIYLKLENMQPIGSFKIRGATYCISRLSAEQKKRGVIAASAGNHAQGVAWGSRLLKVRAQIVMPKNASLIKTDNTRALGAEVILFGDTYDEAFAHAQTLARKNKKTYIHAFENADVIAGQGTVALEILEQLPEVDVVVGSMGGGGLMAGVSIALNALKPKTMLVGCQSSGASALLESIKKGSTVAPKPVNTFADGVAVGMVSEPVRKILTQLLDETLQADDEAIAAAVLTLIEKAKVVAEGSGALPLAALDHLRKKIRGKKVVLIVSGGNIDVNLLSRIIDRGMIRAGRRLRMNVLIHDRPGSLARLTQLIASHGANVLQAIHDRSEPSTTIDQTEVALTLETRGPEHSHQLIAALKGQVIRVELTH